jgi:aspartate/methionine/tyrosine aminotransferase
MERLEIIADSYLSPSTPAQLALASVLAQRDLAQEPLRQRLRENLSALDALHTSQSAWQRLKVEGGWSAVLRIPAAHSEQEWVLRLVEEEGVVVHPGFFFDFPSPAFVAVSLIVPPAQFREGLERITRRFDEG